MNLVLRSDRLTLAPFAESDVDIAIQMFTDPQVVRYAGGTIGEDKIRKELPKWVRRGGNGCIGIWCISATKSGEKLGTAALLPMPEIVATFDAGNHASRNVLVKAGFVDRGMRRCYAEEGVDFRISRARWLAMQ